MEILIAAIIALQLYGAAQPVAGTYQIAIDSGGIIRLDTRTGLAERCALIDGKLSCVPVAKPAAQVARLLD